MKIYNYFKKKAEENISQEFRLKNLNETKFYLIEEVNLNELITKKGKNICTNLNYIKHFLILASTISCMYLNFCCYFFDWYSYRNYEFCNWIQICTITAGIKKYQSIIQKKNIKIVSLAKYKLNKIEVLVSKYIIDSNISHDEFVSVNNVLKEYEEMKKEIKNLKS